MIQICLNRQHDARTGADNGELVFTWLRGPQDLSIDLASILRAGLNSKGDEREIERENEKRKNLDMRY